MYFNLKHWYVLIIYKMHTPEFESDENFLIYHWQYIQCDTIKTGSLYHEIFTIDTPKLMAVCYKKAPHCYIKKSLCLSIRFTEVSSFFNVNGHKCDALCETNSN